MASTMPVVSPNGHGVPTKYNLDIDQTLKASQSLLNHVQAEARRLQATSSKKNLLETAGDDSNTHGGSVTGNDTPIWLNLTCKQHIVDKNRLRPSKIVVPHSLNTSANLSICVIAADPQRSLKNLVADPAFPTALSSRITKVIGYTKLKARYHTFESRRQLLNEYDIFLADDRIITRLPETLGKVFYKGTAKRPIPIRIAHQERAKGNSAVPELKKKLSKAERAADFAPPAVVAKEIETTLNAVPVSLKPGTNVAVRVGLANFTGAQLAENVSVVVQAVVDKHVVKGWKNVRSIHIKSPNSAAVPIWLADDMWVGETDIIEDEVEEEKVTKDEVADGAKKRKRIPLSRSGPQTATRKKAKNGEAAPAADERVEAAARKAKLSAQKEAFQKGPPRAVLAASA